MLYSKVKEVIKLVMYSILTPSTFDPSKNAADGLLHCMKLKHLLPLLCSEYRLFHSSNRNSKVLLCLLPLPHTLYLDTVVDILMYPMY